MPKPLTGSILTRRFADDTLIVDVKIRGELEAPAEIHVAAQRLQRFIGQAHGGVGVG